MGGALNTPLPLSVRGREEGVVNLSVLSLNRFVCATHTHKRTQAQSLGII